MTAATCSEVPMVLPETLQKMLRDWRKAHLAEAGRTFSLSTVEEDVVGLGKQVQAEVIACRADILFLKNGVRNLVLTKMEL